MVSSLQLNRIKFDSTTNNYFKKKLSAIRTAMASVVHRTTIFIFSSTSQAFLHCQQDSLGTETHSLRVSIQKSADTWNFYTEWDISSGEKKLYLYYQTCRLNILKFFWSLNQNLCQVNT